MNKFFKRLALLLAVLMIVSMMPVQLFADNSVITYVNNGTENGEDGTTTTEVASYVTVELEFGSNVSAEDIAAAKALYEGKKFDTCKAANEAYMALFGVTWGKGYLDVTDNSAPLYKYAGVSGSVAEVKYYIHGTLAGFTSLQSNYNNIDCTVGGNHQIARTSISIIGVNDENGGKAKLTDGNIQAYVAGGYISSFTASGKLTIDNIEFTSTTSTTVGASAAKDANSTQEVTSAEMEIKNCKFNGRLYVYDNFDNAGVMTYYIHDNVFDGANYNGDSNAYAIFAQCKGGNKLIIADNKISGFARGINIDHANVNATISGNTISIKDAGRSCIQLSSLTSTVISNNTLELTGGNAITLHEKLLTLTAAPNVTVEGNTITGNGYLIYDDAAANNKAFTSENLKLTIGTNTVASTVNTTQGVKGSVEYDLSKTVDTVVKDALTPTHVANVAKVNGVGYASLAEAIANATPDAKGTIIYEIYGKATVDSTGWIQVARADLTGLTKVEFVGKTSDAEICITGGLAILADQNYDIDVSFKALTLSKLNPTYGGDYGHSTNYFTTWLRNTNAAENTVTYTNCTFPNGACNNQFGKTVFDGCKFTNATSGKYNFWNYGGNTEIKNSTFTGVRGIKTYNEGTLAVAPTVKIENTKFDGLTEKAAIVASKATDITLDKVSATDCTEGLFQKDIEGSSKDEKITITANGSAISGTFNITADKTTAAAKEEFNISGGTFTSEVSSDYLADGFELKDNGNGTYGVKTASVAKIGTVEYATLAEAIAALNSTNHTLTLIDPSAWDKATPVYWQAGTQSGYAAKLTDALTAAYKANAGDITIVCRPGADVGAMTHGHVADNLTVYGNNAYISGGECDLEVDTCMYSRETGKQVATGGVYLDKDITITAYELDNLGVWGQRHTGFTINISLNDCDGKAIEGKANVQRVYISVKTGVNNITVVGCDFLTKATALYSNADGKITIDNCSFTGSQVPVNFNHKANGTQTVTVKNSTFTNCGDNGDWKQFAAPVRFVNSGSGTSTATVDNCTFKETVGANGDILLGDGRNGEASFNVSVTVVNTEAYVQIHQPGYYGADGSTTNANCEKTTVTKSDTPTTFFTVAVAEVTFTDGTAKKYSDIAEALEAANAGDTVTLLADINTPEKTYEITKSLTIDLNGKTVTGSGYDGVFEVTGKNINVVLNATNGGKVIAVENSGSAGKYAMAVWMCGAGSTLTINGGEFIQNITSTNDKQMDMIYASAGTIIINSGSFTSGTPKWTLNIKDSAYKNRTANIIVNGGTFTDYDPRNAENEGKGTSLVADGVGIDKNADGTFTAKSGMVAQIVDADGNSVAAYATLADAIKAANAGDTVKLLANLTETDAANAHIVYDLTGKTLDLNGFTYSHNNFAHVFEGTGGTIKNGKMVCLNSSSYALFIGDEGETTSFTVDGVEMVGGINIYNASGVVLKNLTVNGTNYYAVWMDEGASATIESGTYNAGDVAVLGSGDKSELHVTGGTFCANEQKLVSANKNGVVAISGGSFTKEVLPEYCADRYIPTQNADGTYGVKEATKGSEKNPYTLKELGAMTRAEYIAAQEALGGTMYVEIDNYSYGTNGVLGNGVRNDTPGQMPDHSKLNAYAENGYLGANNDGANGKNIIFVGGSITSGVEGYTSIDNIGTSLLLAVPAYTNVTFEGVTFNNVMSFDYQLYTSPWSQLGELKFSGCTFNGLIVGAIAAQTLTFDGCEFKNYTNKISANNSNPTWIRPAYGSWSKGDNDGQGSDFKSLTTINFTKNKVTSTRPVKFEYISQWDITSTVTATGNYFDITAQSDDTSIKNVGLYLGAHTDANEFHLVAADNTKSKNTAALYTIPSGKTSLPVDSTVKNTAGESIELTDALKWKATDAEKDKIVLKTVIAVASIGERRFATLEEAVAAVAKNGEEVTIKLLSNITAGGIDVAAGQNIVFDFDGHTYTLDGSMVGSTGTKTNGFRFLKGSTVVLKNGTLANGNGSPAKAMINSYATLKLVDFSVDARTTAVAETGSAYGYAALYISNGVTTVTGNGNYTTSDDNFVILIANVGDYTDGASLVFDENYTGTVSGRVSTGNKQNATVEIKNGKFDLKSIDVENTNTTVTISGGKFKNIEIAGKYLDNKAFDTEADADGYYAVMAHPIESFGVTVGEGLSLRLYVRDEYRNGKLLIKYVKPNGRDGETIEKELKINSVIENVNGTATIRYCARIFNITPQMADVVIKVQYVDETGVAIGSEKEVSILKYCQNYVKEDSPESVKIFISKLLEYCATAMDYRIVTNADEVYSGNTWQKRAEMLRKEKVSICGEANKEYKFENLGTYTNIGETFTTRGMEYDSVIKIFFAIDASKYNSNYKYYLNGNEISPIHYTKDDKDQYRFYFTIAPYEYHNSIRITIKNGEDDIGEYACSLDIILESFSKKSGNAELDALARLSVAAYEYCRSLADYPTSKDFNQ